MTFRAPQTKGEGANVLLLDGVDDMLGSSSSDFITLDKVGVKVNLDLDVSLAASNQTLVEGQQQQQRSSAANEKMRGMLRKISLSRDPRHYSPHGIPRQSLPLLAFNVNHNRTGSSNGMLDKRTDSYNEALVSPLELDVDFEEEISQFYDEVRSAEC